MARKGEAIRFKRGKYLGKSGWVNDDKDRTAKMIYVIVDIGGGVEHETRVHQDSIGRPRQQPVLYADALLQQHPDIESAMEKLCRELAKCGIENNTKEVAKIISNKLCAAVVRQGQMGHKAVYRRVTYKENS
jgi:hypothetical protein